MTPVRGLAPGERRETLTSSYVDNAIVKVLASRHAQKRGTDSSQQEVRIMTIARRPSPSGESSDGSYDRPAVETTAGDTA